MDDELQELRDQVAQLVADNDRLRRERAPATPSSSAGTSAVPASHAAPGSDRLVFIPRDRKCPTFRGRTGISVGEWVEEAQACMRARHLAPVDQAFFLYDHLEGEARDEIKFRPSVERGDPAKIISILQELYGLTESYVALQEAFFSRRQQEGESLQEFSLALMSLMERVKQKAPGGMLNAEILLRDQFVEYVLDGSLRRELKQYVRQHPGSTLLVVRGEAIRWVQEGSPASVRGRSNSVPSAFGLQYTMHGVPKREANPARNEFGEMKELLKRQQEQLDLLTRSISHLQTVQQRDCSPRRGPIRCRRCQQLGHIARDCDGPRVPRRQQAAAPTPRHLGLSSEN